jgi:hypothetical protein
VRGVLLFVAAFVALLAGCATPGLEVAKISDIRPINKAAGLDVYDEQRRKGEKVPDFAGDQLVEVRSYKVQEESELAGPEIAGAKCALSARDYVAEVVTPARVRVPLYRSQSSPLSVSCTLDGYQPRSVVIEAYNKTKAERYAASSGSGLAGLLVMAAINELSDEKTHTFAYPMARVIMRPLGKGGAPRPPKTAAASQ